MLEFKFSSFILNKTLWSILRLNALGKIRPSLLLLFQSFQEQHRLLCLLQALIPAQDLNRKRSSLFLRERICLFGTHALAFIIIPGLGQTL